MANGDDEVDLSSLDTGDESSDMVDASTEAVRGLKAATDEMEKTRRALILTGMANQEAQLPPAIPPQGSAAPAPTGSPGYEFGRGIGVLLPPGATPPAVAAPRNRTYIGPMTGAPGASPQAFFDARGTPNNTVESLAPVSPPMTHEQLLSSGYITEPTERLTPNNVAWTPAYEQWAAQQDLKAAIERGVPPQTAMAQYPAAILGSGTRTGTMNQNANLAERQRQFDLRRADAMAAANQKPIVQKISDTLSVVQVPGSKAWRLVDSKTGTAKQFSPAQAASLLTRITKEEQDTGASALSGMKDQLIAIAESGVPAKSEKTEAPKTGGKRVRVKSPNGKIGNIPESQLADALKQGYKQVP